MAVGGSVVQLSDSILSIEQGGGLLEGTALGLDDEEVDKDELEGDPDAIDNLSLR